MADGVYKRGNRWRVRYRDADGKNRSESARTYDDAVALRRKRLTERDDGTLTISRVTFHAYASEWVERYQGRGRRGFREHTREDYRRDLSRYAFAFKPRRKVSEITPRDIALFVAWLCDDAKQWERRRVEARANYDAAVACAKLNGKPAPRLPEILRPDTERPSPVLKDATVRRILSPVRACLASAVQEGLIRHNPTRDAALPNREGEHVDEEDVRALSREQLATFLLVVRPDWRVFFEVLATTGLRVSEALALRWSDLQLDGSTPHVHVRRAFVKGTYSRRSRSTAGARCRST